MINKVVLILLIINLIFSIHRGESSHFICMSVTALIYCMRVVIYEAKLK